MDIPIYTARTEGGFIALTPEQYIQYIKIKSTGLWWGFEYDIEDTEGL